MALIKKSIVFLVCFGVLPCNAGNFEIHVSDQKIIQGIKEEFEKKYSAHDADEAIDTIVQETLKKCGISKPVIALQTNREDNSYLESQPQKHPQLFMILGVKGQNLDQIRSSIYHEVGHIAHGDVSSKEDFNRKIILIGSEVLSLGTGFAVRQMLQKCFKRMPITNSVVGGAVSLGVLVSTSLISLYRESLKERRADIFAYENLLKHNKLGTAIGQISDYICGHENCRYEQLPAFVTGYPTDLQRAKIGLDVLQKNGIVISTLIKNLPESMDQGIKNAFPRQIKQWFPALV